MARLCENTAHIGYTVGRNPVVYPNYGTIINKNKVISKSEVNDILNDSLVGGIFSTVEGGCRASAEYLLCGLPVVSIKSQGGREIYYNKNNSIICQNDPDSVKKAVEECIIKIKSGFFNREKIRQMHIEQSNIYRNNLVEHVLNFIKDKEIVIDNETKTKLCKDLLNPH